MSRKYYCDSCGQELKRRDHDRLRKKEAGISVVNVEVMTAVNGTWNKSDLCHECVVRVVTSGDYTQDEWTPEED